METKNFTVSPQTAGYIEALDAYENAKNIFLQALIEHYGEQQGDNFYQDSHDVLEAVTAKIGEYLLLSVTENLGITHPGGGTVEV